MKFKHLLLTASVMALFSSCSNDELVSENTSHGDAIAFSVTTTNATRAADYWCNSNLPHFFEVSATYKDPTATKANTYFNGEMYSQNTEGKYIQNDGNYRFWPAISESNPLNVWAYKVKAETKNGDNTYTSGSEFATFAWNDGAPTITMEPATKAAEQHDLLYAYTQVKTKPAYGATAAINFRHALSQIVFYAKCENKKVYVEIEEIALVNAAKSGIFTLPTGTNVTNDNLKDHTQAGTAKTDGLGTWALTYDGTTTTTGEGEGQTSTFTQNKAYYAYTASCLKSDGTLTALTPDAGEDAWTNLTDNKNPATAESGTHSEYGQSLLVLPQTKYSESNNNNVAAYVPKKTDGTYQPLSSVGGACIAIKCKIRNISGITSPVDENDIYLWGSKNKAEYLVVPVDFTWEQGKKYIYRINFSKLGHGGYNPEDGKEVLVPIQLSVKVDDFAEVTDIEKTADGDNL